MAICIRVSRVSESDPFVDFGESFTCRVSQVFSGDLPDGSVIAIDGVTEQYLDLCAIAAESSIALADIGFIGARFSRMAVSAGFLLPPHDPKAAFNPAAELNLRGILYTGRLQLAITTELAPKQHAFVDRVMSSTGVEVKWLNRLT